MLLLENDQPIWSSIYTGTRWLSPCDTGFETASTFGYKIFSLFDLWLHLTFTGLKSSLFFGFLVPVQSLERRPSDYRCSQALENHITWCPPSFLVSLDDRFSTSLRAYLIKLEPGRKCVGVRHALIACPQQVGSLARLDNQREK